jgi:uncharacterized protein YbjT (DUF2867 family)
VARLPVVVVAGATGFVGQRLGPRLRREFVTVGLSRGAHAPDAAFDEYRCCNLLSLSEATAGLAGADHAVFLVHSMMPRSRGVHGEFRDLDLLCADNFARAATAVGVKQIVYLGGIIPADEKLSTHLQSRLEVECALAAHGTATTTLRSGLILGAAGSSFQILRRLAERLPVLPDHAWTTHRAQPIAIADVVEFLARVVGRPDLYHRSFDIGSPDVATHHELAMRTSTLLGRSLRAVPAPGRPLFADLWISLLTGAPRALTSPVVASLDHELLVANRDLEELTGYQAHSIHDALRAALDEGPTGPPHAFHGAAEHHGARVFSVYRSGCAEGATAAALSAAYFRRIAETIGPLLQVRQNGSEVSFLALARTTLLRLTLDETVSSHDRYVWQIRDGLLVGEPGGSLELRVVRPDVALIIVADFVPRLPTRLYGCTQAAVHQWVTRSFARAATLAAT